MLSMNQILYSLIVCILIQRALPQESPELSEEYIDEDLPEAGGEEEIASTPKPLNPNELNHKKSNFSDDRFTKLFGPRRNRPQPSGLVPKFGTKPKPTLPSFIKNTPAIIKAQPTQAPTQQRFNQRSVATTSRTTTTRTPARGGSASNRRNQITNNRSNVQSTTSPTTTTTDASARRRFGGSNRRFNTNSTIPATIKPKRN